MDFAASPLPRPAPLTAAGLRAGAVALGLLALLAPGARARAEGVVERVARTGQLVLVGDPAQPPLLSRDGRGQPQGFGVEVARRIAAELGTAVGRPVSLRFHAVADPAALGQRIATGQADLACGVPFSWERDMMVDYSLPIGLSGLRLLAPAGRFDGAPAALAGRSIGVVRDSLAETELRGMQPAARVVPLPTLAAAVTALQAGQVEGVIGDSTLLAGLVAARGATGLALTPELPYERFAVACLVPENDSAFRNLVNLAIARLLQDYLDGRPAALAAVDRWLGPGSALQLPQERIRAYFETVLLGVEAIRPLPPAAAAAPRPAP